jgi:CrcB protein
VKAARGRALRAPRRSRNSAAVPGLPLQIVLVALGGAMGAVTRLLVGIAITARAGDAVPWGTFVINVSGCFVLGVVLGGLQAGTFHLLARPLVATGFLGAYTTFSTFGAETILLLEEGSVLRATAYVVASVALGLVAAVFGLALGRSLV